MWQKEVYLSDALIQEKPHRLPAELYQVSDLRFLAPSLVLDGYIGLRNGTDLRAIPVMENLLTQMWQEPHSNSLSCKQW